MAGLRPLIAGFRVVLAAMLILSVVPAATAAAPGPLRGDPPPTESSEPDQDEPNTGATDTSADPADDNRTRLEYRAPEAGDVDGGTTTSHRSSIASRTAAGSSPPDDDDPERAIPDPEVEHQARPEPEPPEFARVPYEIQESGRPRRSTDSILAYDGDPATSWSAGDASPQSYVWLDLGDERPVSGVRWFQPVVDGPVAIQISNDRETWTTVVVDDQPVAGAWRQADIGQPARFVRIVVGNQSQRAELAEVQVFGPRGVETASADEEQASAQADTENANRPPRVTITGGGERGRQAAEDVIVVTPEPDSEAVEITVNGQTARCTDGERCRVETPRPEVVEDCGDGTTTCTIRISNSGGLAVCNASGGNRGRNSKNGGSCTADGSGGTITVSDVNR